MEFKEEKYSQLNKIGNKKYPSQEHLYYYLKEHVFDSLYRQNIPQVGIESFINTTAYLNHRLIKKYKLEVFEDGKNKDDIELCKLLFSIDKYFIWDAIRYDGLEDMNFHTANIEYHFDYVFQFKFFLLEHRDEIKGWFKSQNWYYMTGDAEAFEHFTSLVRYTQTVDLLRAPIIMGSVAPQINWFEQDVGRYLFTKGGIHSNAWNIVNIFVSFVNLNCSWKYSWKLEKLRISRE